MNYECDYFLFNYFILDYATGYFCLEYKSYPVLQFFKSPLIIRRLTEMLRNFPLA